MSQPTTSIKSAAGLSGKLTIVVIRCAKQSSFASCVGCLHSGRRVTGIGCFQTLCPLSFEFRIRPTLRISFLQVHWSKLGLAKDAREFLTEMVD